MWMDIVSVFIIIIINLVVLKQKIHLRVINVFLAVLYCLIISTF